MSALRHDWVNGETHRSEYKTERTCARAGCGITKVTWHQPNVWPWNEWFRNGVKIVPGGNTPACVGASDPPKLRAVETEARDP